MQDQVFGSNTNNTSYANSNEILWQLIDLNPSIYSSGSNLSRIGTITDGVSKLQLLIDYNETARLTIKGNEDLKYGTINANQSQLADESNNESSLLVSPSATHDGSLINVEYTPPQSYPVMNDGRNNSYTTVVIEVRDNYTVVSNIPIRLYRVPVVLVHGVWTDSDKSWKETNFDTILINKGFNVSFADYRNHNTDTFDPYANITIGNQGIDSLRKTIRHVLNDYREHKFIAASQVDVIAHSMGGLIARGYTQQPGYINEDNYMKGFLHRLITIGTPHFGADLAGILYEHRNDWYCYNPITNVILFPNGCQYNTSYEFIPLKTIYSEGLGLPIDRGAIQAMGSEDSIAYRHMCSTNITSYAIAGSWFPGASNGHSLIETFYRNLLNDPTFNLDIDGFEGDFIGNNDLQVDLISQTGGLNSSFRQLTDSGTNIDSIPRESSVYPNTIHSSNWILGNTGVFSELNSPRIQQDIVALLNSSDEKFADNIGIGSMCIRP